MLSAMEPVASVTELKEADCMKVCGSLEKIVAKTGEQKGMHAKGEKARKTCVERSESVSGKRVEEFVTIEHVDTGAKGDGCEHDAS